MIKKTLSILLLFITVSFAQQKPMLMWFDATANFERFSYPDSIKYYLQKTKELGFTDVVVDIRPITGELLVPSKIAPQMKEWNGFTRPDNVDFLNLFITESHKLGLKIHASMNMFVGGHNYFNRGIVYNDKQSWQSINLTDSGLVPITKLKHKYSSMMNPGLFSVRTYLLSLIKELAENYKTLDGIILDRGRYDGIESDFSDSSKIYFEKFISQKVTNWPDDIFKWVKDEKGKSIRKEGTLYKKWLEFRVSNISKFFTDARTTLKNTAPKMAFGDYAGSWYPTYFEVGVNWASKNYDPSLEYPWATENYKNYGYAAELDFFTTGNYYTEVTKEEVEKINTETIKRGEAGMGQGKEYWYSVEGSAELVNKVVMHNTPVYAGLYVDQYKTDSEQFKKAVQMCLQKSDGLMIFDIVHIINKNWWQPLKEALNN